MKAFKEQGIFFIIIGGMALLGLLPIFFLILMSLSKGWLWPEIIPHRFSLEAWKYVLGEHSQSVRAIATSLSIALVVTIINLFLALPAGDALGRYEFKGKKFIEFFLLVPIIVPPIVILMGMHKSFIAMNLAESFWGVVLAHIIPTLPYMIRAITIGYQHLGFQWEEQAKMLGAGKWKRFTHVLLPFLLPSIIAGSSLSILISFSQYIITLFIGGGQVLTLPMVMVPYISGGDQSIGAVYAIIFALMAVFVLTVLQGFLKGYYR